MLKSKLSTILALAVISLPCYAATKPVSHQKVANEYKACLMKASPAVLKEIKKFRKQQNEKAQSLSQAAKDYLAQEAKFEKKLPEPQRRLMESRRIAMVIKY